MENKLKAFASKVFARSPGVMWLLIIIWVALIIWTLLDIASTAEIKEWYTTPIKDMQIKDVLIVGLAIAWFLRSSNSCTDSK